MRSESVKGAAGGVVFITLTLLCWSSVPLFLKYFTSYIDGWTANGWRYGISALFWSPVVLMGLRRDAWPPGMWRAAIVPSLFNITLQSCFAWSPYFINPGLLTFMLRFPQVLFVAAGAYLLFPSERRILRSRIYWLGAIVVLAGSTGICLLGHDLPRGTTALGIALAVSAGLAFGGYSLSIRHFMHDVHPVVAFAVISQYTAAGLVVIMLVVGDQHGFAVMSLTNCQAGLLMASGLVGIAFAHVFYYWSIAKLGVAVSAGVILLQPFVTGATSYFLFGEELTAAQWAAGAVAVVGAGLMLRTQHRLSRS